MRSFLTKLWRDAEAATAVEYALMLAFVALVVIGVVTLLGQTVSSKFEDMNTNFPD